LEKRLAGRPQIAELKAVYLELSTVTGQIQGALHETTRESGPTSRIREAESKFEEFKRTLRQVGFDIRLASPSALQVGMQTALDHALQTLAYLADEPD
jgi:hypothetical protein